MDKLKQSEYVNYKLAYPKETTRSSWFDATKYGQTIAAPEREKERLLKSAREEATKYGLPGKMSKGSAGRESAEKQRDKYARTAIRAGAYR